MAERSLDKVSVSVSDACDWSAWVSDKLNEAIIENTTSRKRVVAACFAVVLDHFDAILALLGRNPKICSSAFALMRLTYESYVRGLWLAYCATDDEVEKLSANNFELPKTPKMIKAIESVGFDKHLSNIYSTNWKQLCDYTHTGALQIQGWNTAFAIEPNYSDDEIIDVVRFSRGYAFAAAVSFAESVIENSSLANEILEKGKQDIA